MPKGHTVVWSAMEKKKRAVDEMAAGMNLARLEQTVLKNRDMVHQKRKAYENALRVARKTHTLVKKWLQEVNEPGDERAQAISTGN